MTEFVFIRHGQTDWNREQRFQGQANPPLNTVGLAQAECLARRLAGTPADALFCSDLQRAQQTAAPLATRWQLTPQLRPRLREQAFGCLEGWQVPQIQQAHPQLWAQWLEHRADFALPDGGESLRQFQGRVLADVEDLARQYPGARLAVVTHGGVLDMLWRAAYVLPLDGLRVCDIPNTGLNHLRWSDGRLQVLSWGDATHLAELDGRGEPLPMELRT